MSKQQPWYAIRAKAAQQSAEVLIFGDIGESWSDESVTAAQFVRDIGAIDATNLTVRINSFGGSVPDGLAMYNALKRHPANVTVNIEGIAASIASLIAMAGDTVEMANNAMFMVHAPWAVAVGNSVAMREMADTLDLWAEAMSASYVAKTGKNKTDMMALLLDGKDHWYTAEQAQTEGFIDNIVDALPMAASLDLSRYQNLPAAAAAFSKTSKETPMPPVVQGTQDPAATAQPVAAATTAQPAPSPQADEQTIRAAALQADQQRRNAIAANAATFMAHSGMPELVASLQNDHTISEDEANKRILAHLAKDSAPVAGGYAVVREDARDKFQSGVTQAILARCGFVNADGKREKPDPQNEFRGMRLEDIARASLEQAGRSVKGMDRIGIVKAALAMRPMGAQTTSDFPVLLENVMHRQVLTAYAITPDTWTQWCKIGTVSDFREWLRLRGGSIGNIDTVNEAGEYKNLIIPDMAKEGISAVRRGAIINITPEIIINDDIGYISDTTSMLGRAAKRTIESQAYAKLVANPTLKDGVALFHADHGNLASGGSAAAVTVASLDAARVAMASQTDLSGNEFLDIRPAIWLGPIGKGGNARVVVDALYDPDTANKLQRPNMVNGIVQNIIDTPRLSGNAWYLLADPTVAPVIEVVFLDGQSEPVLAMEENFDTAGVRYRVEHPFGVGAVGFEGAYRNDGA